MLKISGDSLTVALKDIYALVSIASNDKFVAELLQTGPRAGRIPLSAANSPSIAIFRKHVCI